MLRLSLAAALIFQAAPQADADKAAAELLKKMEEQVMKAKTLHIEFEAVPGEGREDKMVGEVKVGENGTFYMKFTVGGRGGGAGMEMMLRSDGKAIVGSAARGRGGDFTKWNPAAVQKCLKRATTSANFLGAYLLFGRDVDPETAFDEFAPKNVKSEGKEKVGAVEASVVSFTLELKDGPPGGLTFKIWVDPAKLTVLKREVNMGREALVETSTRFELNAVFPADFFEFQTAAMHLEGRTTQLATSVLLHARYTGRLPKTLEDLNRRPADLPAAVFWPEGGFWIGGAIPKDIAYTSDATHFTVGSIREPIPVFSPVGMPTDRVKKFFNYRVQIQLLKAAAQGYQKSSAAPPKNPLDLVKKPDAVKFWPEGGWIGGGSLPADPWGDAYVISAGESFSIALAKPRGRVLKLTDLTPEERKGLEVASQPELTDKDAAEVKSQFKNLGAEKLADREAATKAIIAKGGGALKIVVERLATEKDPEVASRLGLIRDHFQSVKSTWVSELKSGRYALAGTGGDARSIPANERNGSTCLKTLTTAQADFRSNDRDGNRTMDFYARDVAGLYALKGATGKETEATPGKEDDAGTIMKLIEPSIAKADTTEDRWEYPVLGISSPEPKSGYFFAVLKNYEEGGKVEPYHTGNGRNDDRFGFVAYPAEYGVTGRMTFIVNEDNTIWMKDLAGEDVDTFPADPAAAGWRKLD
jgi:hypothetical protein